MKMIISIWRSSRSSALPNMQTYCSLKETHLMKPHRSTHPVTLSLIPMLAETRLVLHPVRSRILHQSGHGRRIFLQRMAALLALGFVVQVHAQADEVQNPPEVAGFRGEVIGTVKSTLPGKPSFVLVINKAEVAGENSTLKDGAPLLGKELTIGVRMPKNSEGVGSPHPDDIAYIKSLKPGMLIKVKIFSVHNNPRVLRIQAPGQSAKEP